MAKQKTLEQLRAEKERAETQLAQEQHKLQRLENRKQYYEKGERQKRTHRLCNPGGTIESLAIENRDLLYRKSISMVITILMLNCFFGHRPYRQGLVLYQPKAPSRMEAIVPSDSTAQGITHYILQGKNVCKKDRVQFNTELIHK